MEYVQNVWDVVTQYVLGTEDMLRIISYNIHYQELIFLFFFTVPRNMFPTIRSSLLSKHPAHHPPFLEVTHVIHTQWFWRGPTRRAKYNNRYRRLNDTSIITPMN